MKKTIGGQRLGSGNNMNVDLHGFGRSNHDLSRVWRSTLSPGTLVPFMTEIGLNGDSFDIDLETMVRTMPTIGPLFGSFKLQMDVFVTPIRLYNARLHNNELNIGMNMKSIRLPELSLKDVVKTVDSNNSAIGFNPSSLISYLGLRGIGSPKTLTGDVTIMKRRVNAVPLLAYWDIFKNYYANKQEENAYVISGVSNPNTASYLPETVANTGGATYTTAQLINKSVTKKWGGPNATQLAFNFASTGATTMQKFAMLRIETTEGWKMVKEIVENVKLYGATVNCNIPSEKVYTFSRMTSTSALEMSTLRPFPLKNIDDCRTKILTGITTIDAGMGYPYWQTTECATESPYANVSNNRWAQNGLAVKTYQSDLFNNWLKTDWIDGPSGIGEITKVSVTDNAFKLDALNMAQKIYNMMNRIAVSGGTYEDWQEAVWGDEVIRRAETPMYMGGMSTEIVFDEVVATAATQTGNEQTPLGGLAGRGTQNGRTKGGKIAIKIKEPSIIQGIVSITPRIDYSQGNKWYMNLKTMDDLHKPNLDGIGYQELITEQMHYAEAKVGTEYEDTITRYSAGKQPAWINYMTAYNEAHGQFAEPDKLMWMTLSRAYNLSNENRINDLTTYIDPGRFNYAFADTSLNAQNFWVQLGINVHARRKMSAKQIPNL